MGFRPTNNTFLTNLVRYFFFRYLEISSDFLDRIRVWRYAEFGLNCHYNLSSWVPRTGTGSMVLSTLYPKRRAETTQQHRERDGYFLSPRHIHELCNYVIWGLLASISLDKKYILFNMKCMYHKSMKECSHYSCWYPINRTTSYAFLKGRVQNTNAHLSLWEKIIVFFFSFPHTLLIFPIPSVWRTALPPCHHRKQDLQGWYLLPQSANILQ